MILLTKLYNCDIVWFFFIARWFNCYDIVPMSLLSFLDLTNMELSWVILGYFNTFSLNYSHPTNSIFPLSSHTPVVLVFYDIVPMSLLSFLDLTNMELSWVILGYFNTFSLNYSHPTNSIFPLSSHTPMVRRLLWAHCSSRNGGGSRSSTRDALVPVPLVSHYLMAHWIFPIDRRCVWCKPTTNQFKGIIWRLIIRLWKI